MLRLTRLCYDCAKTQNLYVEGPRWWGQSYVVFSRPFHRDSPEEWLSPQYEFDFNVYCNLTANQIACKDILAIL